MNKQLATAIASSIRNHARTTPSRKQPVCFVVSTVLSLIGVESVSAQGANQPTLEEVVVTATTGTTIRGVAPTGSQVITMSHEDLVDTPVRDASSIVAKIPQGSSLGFNEATGGGNHGSSAINLRGLGNNATLVLMNGHRLVPQGIQNIFTDPNQIPFAAIERVEVVMDGASAVYGSDAVAGVVNYILKDKFEGVSFTGRYDTSELFDSYSIDGLFGKNFGAVNLMVALSYEDRGGFIAGERPYLRDDLRRYGGNDNRQVGDPLSPGNPGFIIVGGQTYGIPANNTGIPTAADVLALRGQPNLVDGSDYEGFLPDRERATAFVKLDFEFSDSIDVSYSGLFSKRDSFNYAWRPLQITIPSTSPWYIPGLSPTNAPLTVWYNAADNGRPRYRVAHDYTYNNYLDLTADVGADWQVNAGVSYGTSDGCGNCGPEHNQFVPFEYATREPGLLNPYIKGYQPGVERFYGYTHHMTEGSMQGASLRADGPLFDLPAGTVRMSVGVEFNQSEHHLKLDQNVRDYAATMTVVRDTTKSRDVTSGFVEAFVPLLDSLDLSLAARHDKYSDVGTTTNPRLGLTWSPIGNQLKIQGTWGTAFRAPTLVEVNPGVSYGMGVQEIANNSGDPAFPITNAARGTSLVFRRTGNDENLDPEEAEMFSLGFTYQPIWLDGLTLNVSYYDVDYKNRLEVVPSPNSALSSPENRQFYAPYLIAAPQPSTCVPGDISTYNPIYIPALSNPNRLASGDVSRDCQVVAFQEAGRQNTGRVQQSGLDFQVAYQFDTDAGRWGTTVTWAKILKLDRAILPGAPSTDVLDVIGFQVSDRANLELTWSLDRWRVSAAANYIGSYLNNNPITVDGVRRPEEEVPSWTTFDASISYSIGQNETPSMLAGTRISLGARNLTDKDPPIVLNGTLAVDMGVHDPYGRNVQLELSKSF